MEEKISELAKKVIEKSKANITESELIKLIEEERTHISPSSESSPHT